MDRRHFVLRAAGAVGALLFVSEGVTGTVIDSSRRRTEINADVEEALKTLYVVAPAAQELAAKAYGVLVFPRVGAAAWIVGGQFGEGELRIEGRPVGYYGLSISSLGREIA